VHEDAAIFLEWVGERFAIEVLDEGRPVARAPERAEVEQAAKLLSPANPSWKDDLRRWLGARMDVARLERDLGAAIEALHAPGQGLVEDLAEAYGAAERTLESREAETRRRETVFAGLFGWSSGAFSGYSWSFPFHVARWDETEDVREVALFPVLSGMRFEHGGVELASLPLLAYYASVETPLERAGGAILLGTGRVRRLSRAGESETTFVLPLLALRESSRGEDVAADPGRVIAGERAATHLLGSLVAWSSERPGVYRDRGALKLVGRDRASWRVLPLASHRRDERGSETMLWPLLGFGWGEDAGRGYVRLFYFLKIGG
jgi:hypothetical protein